MHCKNCGAHYRARELACPYCGTENLIGRLWMSQVTDAEIEYEMTRIEEGKGLPIYVMNRVLNRVLLLSGILIAASFLGVVIFSILSGLHVPAQRHLKKAEIESAMESYYEAGAYTQLYELMREYDLLYEDTYPEYEQAARIGNDHENFCQARMEFLSMSKEKQEESEYEFEAAIRDAVRFLNKDFGFYGDIYPENRELMEQCQLDAEGYLRGFMGFTDQEIREIKDAEYFYYSDLDPYIEAARKRGAWR